ncbi:MAG: hypothetical protein RR202_13610 [Bacteroidales bacterium]
MDKNNEIKDFGTRETGFKVPQGYFEEFEKRMDSLIDEAQKEDRTQEHLAPVVSFSARVKPWMYMAAMMISFVVLFRIFIAPEARDERAVLQARSEEQIVLEDALYASVSDYDLYEYLYPEGE